MRRITKAALGGLAGCALIVGATQAANGEPPIEYVSSGVLVPLVPLTENAPFKDASVRLLRIREASAATNFKLTVEGINPLTANSVHGAHLHVGGCATPGPHYHDGSDLEATPQNEVWFDLVTNDHGDATDSTTVSFIPVDNDATAGVMSVVIHAKSAATPALDSPKLACFELRVDNGPWWTSVI
jgi:hypothetical protein